MDHHLLFSVLDSGRFLRQVDSFPWKRAAGFFTIVCELDLDDWSFVSRPRLAWDQGRDGAAAVSLTYEIQKLEFQLCTSTSQCHCCFILAKSFCNNPEPMTNGESSLMYAAVSAAEQ